MFQSASKKAVSFASSVHEYIFINIVSTGTYIINPKPIEYTNFIMKNISAFKLDHENSNVVKTVIITIPYAIYI